MLLAVNMNDRTRNPKGKTNESMTTWKNKKKDLPLLWKGGTCKENVLEENIYPRREGETN